MFGQLKSSPGGASALSELAVVVACHGNDDYDYQ